MDWLALYPRALGEAWRALPEPIRRCHDADPSLVAVGRFTVSRESSLSARVVLALAAMPAAGQDVALRLEVRAGADHQEWRRDFAGFMMTTTQSLLPDGRMAERRGAMELLFRVTSEGGAVIYHPAGARVRLGGLGLPIPSWLAPRVEARAWSEPGDERMHVRVVISAPLVGKICTYGGPLARV